VFRASKTWIASMALPRSTYVLKSVARSVFILGINMVFAVVALLATGHLTNPLAWLAVAAFGILLINAVLMQTYLGYLTARFRDVEHLATSLTRVLFFLTPILWVAANWKLAGYVGRLQT
jgi:ABC-2 type transport system permease protein